MLKVLFPAYFTLHLYINREETPQMEISVCLVIFILEVILNINCSVFSVNAQNADMDTEYYIIMH